jgi:hypothetical protein
MIIQLVMSKNGRGESKKIGVFEFPKWGGTGAV